MTGRETTESATTDLAQLEEEYQVYRNLAAGERVPATVTDVGVTSVDRVLVELSPIEGTAFVVGFEIDPSGLGDLRRLYAAVGRPLTSDLGCIVGDSVTIAFETPRLRRLSVPEAGLSDLVVAPVSRVDERRLTRHLPERYVVALRRVEAYESAEKDDDAAPAPHRVPIDSVGSDDGTLTLVLDLCGEPWTGPIEVPTPDRIDGTAYERVVEEVGHGSVTQVADGVMYAVRAADVEDEPRQTFGSVSDAFSEWLLFTDRDEADAALPATEATESTAMAPHRGGEVARRLLSRRPSGLSVALLAGGALAVLSVLGAVDSVGTAAVLSTLWTAGLTVLLCGVLALSVRELLTPP